MLISRKVTEVSEISHVNLRAGRKELTKPINRSNSSLVQDVAPRQSSMQWPKSSGLGPTNRSKIYSST